MIALFYRARCMDGAARSCGALNPAIDGGGVCGVRSGRPASREARERIVYMRNLRAWFREDAMLLPWQCAALTAGAALNGARELPPPCGLVGPWQAFGSAGLLPHTCRYDRPYIVGTGPAVSYIGGRGKVYGAPHRDAATADAAALADNVALSIDVNEIVLPVGKEGARWRRE